MLHTDVVTLLAAVVLFLASPVRAVLTAPGHTPKINTHWNYTLRVTQAGKPVAARITAQIVDPIGGKHPVEFGKSTKNITNWPIKGAFRDFIIWPASSRGIPLTFRITVVAGKTTRVVNYSVTPHA